MESKKTGKDTNVMTTSDPTTGEVAVFIPIKKSKAVGIFNSINLGRWTQEDKDNAIKTILCAPVPKEICKERMSDVIKFLADRLESQEHKIADKDAKIAALTARAEQAERERDAAIKDIHKCCSTCAYETAEGNCSERVYGKCSNGGRNYYWTWRGLPQDGEGV